MKLKDQDESGDFVIPPIGRYPFKVIASEAKTSAIRNEGTPDQKGGSPMITITGEIRDENYAGAQFFDNMITDESFKGAGHGKKKLRGLGVNVDSEVEIPDEQIAADLLDHEGFVDIEHEPMMGKDGNGQYAVPQFKLVDGKSVPKVKLVAKAYYSADLAVAQAAAGSTLPAPTAPTTQQAAPQGAPAGFPPPQGFPQPGQPVPMPWAQPGQQAGAPNGAPPPPAGPQVRKSGRLTVK